MEKRPEDFFHGQRETLRNRGQGVRRALEVADVGSPLVNPVPQPSYRLVQEIQAGQDNTGNESTNDCPAMPFGTKLYPFGPTTRPTPR